MMMQHEFAQAVCISLTAYLVGIYTYEHAATYKDRWLGRIAILMSVVVLIAFGHYAVEQCAVTQDELAALKNKADSIYQVATVTDYDLELSTGTQIKWSKIDGRRTSMSVVQGRGGAERSGSLSGTSVVGGPSGGVDAMRNGKFNATSADAWDANESTGKAF